MSGTVEAGKLLIQVEASTENLKRQLDQALAAVAGAAQSMTGSTNKINSSFESMNKVVERSLEVFGKVASSVAPVGGSMIGMIAAGNSVAAMFEKVAESAFEYAKSIVEAGDEHRVFIAQLTGVTGSVESATAAFQKLEEMTLDTGIAASQSVEMFRHLSAAAGEVGLSNTQVLQLVKTIQNAGIAAGASGEAMSKVVNAFTVGMLQGNVNARQLRAIMVEMPQLGVEIANNLGKTTEELTKAAKAGKLLTTELTEGTLESEQKMAEAAEKIPTSMARGMRELKGASIQFAASLDEAIGLADTLGKSLHNAALGFALIKIDLGLGTEFEQSQRKVENFAKELKDLRDQLDLAEKFAKDHPIASAVVGTGVRSMDPEKIKADMAKANDAYADAVKERDALSAKAGAATAAADAARAAEGLKNAKANADAAFEVYKSAAEKQYGLKKKLDEDIAGIREKGAAAGRSEADIQAVVTARTKEYDDAVAHLNTTHDKTATKLQAHIKTMQDVVDQTARELDAANGLKDAHMAGIDATEKLNAATEIANKLAAAGIPIASQRTAEEQKSAEMIINNTEARHAAIAADKDWQESNKKAVQANEEMNRELLRISESYAKDISKTLVDQIVDPKHGTTILTWFKDLFKKIAAQALETSIILPITTQIVGGLASTFGASAVGATGGGQQLFNSAGQVVGSLGGTSAGAAGGGGSLGGLGSVFQLGSLGNSLSGGSMFSGVGNSLGFGTGGFFGAGGTVQNFLSTPISLGSSGGVMSGYGGALTSVDVAEAGTGAAGTSALAPATIGGVAGGIGAGFGAGMLANQYLGPLIGGGKPTGGMIGSAVGSAAMVAGAALAPETFGLSLLVAGLIGGTAGGMLGGLIGPGPKHQAYGINLEAAGGTIDVTRAIGSDTAGLKAALDDATAQIAALTSIMSQTGVTVSGTGVIGKGNAVAQPTGFDITQFQFAGPAGSNLATALAHSGGIVQSTQALQDMISFVIGTYEPLSKTAEKTNQYDDAVNALSKTYNDAIAKAQGYGLATDGLSSKLAEGTAKIRQAQVDAITATLGGINQALLVAQGRTYEAQTYQMGSGKQKQLDDLRDQLLALGITAEEGAQWVDKLSQAIDLQIQKIQEANAAQRISVLQQSQIDAMNARGQTYQGGLFKTSIDNATAIKNLTDTLTALGQSAESSKPFIDDLSAALDAQAASALAAHNESVRQLQVKDSLALMRAQVGDDPTKKAAADLATLIESQYEAALSLTDTMTALGFSTDQMSVEYDKLLKTQALERDALAKNSAATTASTDALLNSGKSIQAYIDSLNQTGAGGASPVNQYAAAKQIFGDQLTLAGAGNADALANITSNATAFLDAAKAMYGSGSKGYADAVSLVKKDLSGLPATTSYEAQVLAALKDLGGGINIAVELDMIRNVKEVLEALPTSEKNKLQIAETILHTVEETLGHQLSVAEFDHLLEVQGMAGTYIQRVNQILNGLTTASLTKVLQLQNLDPLTIQTVEQKMKSLTTAEFDRVAKLEGLDPLVIQKVEQELTALGSSDWQTLLKAEGYGDDVIQAIKQTLHPLTPDQLVQIENLANLDPAVLQTITQFLKTTGDPLITADSLTKKITQDVTTTEAITVHISDTLDTIFHSMWVQLGEIIKYSWAIAQNTGQLAEAAGRTPQYYLSPTTPSAFGNVFMAGNVIPFRNGGVVNVPTYAPMALFGEAGPEAIMPLQRDSSGRLGVSAQGSNSGQGMQMSGSDDSEDVTAAFAQVALVLRDELRLLRGDVQDMRSALRRAVAA